jgi:CheY-like chemotaxis protein
MEESDGSSQSILEKHPRVLLVFFGKSLGVLYGICLEQAGCNVESAPDNKTAMRLYREHGPYDIVLTHFFNLRELSKRIRERNPEQAIAIVGACSAMSVRFSHKVPVLREGFRPEKLIRLVESAIKQRVRILLVGDEYCDLWDFVVNYVTNFELEVESTAEDGLRRYREHGPYDIVLTKLPFVPRYLARSRQRVGMDGSDLALAIRRQNPAQRIAVFTEDSSPTVRRSIQRKLRDIPVLRGEDVFEAMKELRYEPGAPFGGELLLASVNRVIAKKQKRIRKSAASKKQI